MSLPHNKLEAFVKSLPLITEHLHEDDFKELLSGCITGQEKAQYAKHSRVQLGHMLLSKLVINGPELYDNVLEYFRHKSQNFMKIVNFLALEVDRPTDQSQKQIPAEYQEHHVKDSTYLSVVKPKSSSQDSSLVDVLQLKVQNLQLMLEYSQQKNAAMCEQLQCKQDDEILKSNHELHLRQVYTDLAIRMKRPIPTHLTSSDQMQSWVCGDVDAMIRDLDARTNDQGQMQRQLSELRSKMKKLEDEKLNLEGQLGSARSTCAELEQFRGQYSRQCAINDKLTQKHDYTQKRLEEELSAKKANIAHLEERLRQARDEHEIEKDRLSETIVKMRLKSTGEAAPGPGTGRAPEPKPVPAVEAGERSYNFWAFTAKSRKA